jgi:hypothetical protein
LIRSDTGPAAAIWKHDRPNQTSIASTDGRPKMLAESLIMIAGP